jgi:hypothetical protein
MRDEWRRFIFFNGQANGDGIITTAETVKSKSKSKSKSIVTPAMHHQEQGEQTRFFL